MSSIAVIRSLVERRIPGALTVYERRTSEVFPTGIAAVDHEVGGIPKSALTQLCAPVGVTSGRTTLLLSLLGQVTGKEQFCALVDAGDSFDPESADVMGVCLSRLLWVRCTERGMKAVEQTFKAADILIQNGGFGVIAVDLSNVDERLIQEDSAHHLVPLSPRHGKAADRTCDNAALFCCSKLLGANADHGRLYRNRQEQKPYPIHN